MKLHLGILALSIVAAGTLSGCAVAPVRIIDSEWASMTKSSVPKRSELTEIGSVSGKFCHDSFGSGHHGLMDEALLDAQKRHQADYIKNAVFMMDRKNVCVSVDGIGYRSKTN